MQHLLTTPGGTVPQTFTPAQTILMQEFFEPNNGQQVSMSAMTPNTQFVLAQQQQQQQLQQLQQQSQHQQQQQYLRIKATAKPGVITTPSEVSQNTAISDRPKVKPVSKKDGKVLRKSNITNIMMPQQQHQQQQHMQVQGQTQSLHQHQQQQQQLHLQAQAQSLQQQPMFRQNQMVSIYNNLVKFISNFIICFIHIY